MSINIYTCEKCEYKTHIKCNYDKHLLTLKHKKKQPKSNPESNLDVNDEKERFRCKECNVLCSYRQSYERHIKKNCKMRQIINQVNSNNITNSNINSNNTNVNIINFSDRMEGSFLTDKDYLVCLSKVGNSVVELIKKQYLNDKYPEHKNVRVTNQRSKYLQVYNDDRWNLKLKVEIFDTLYQESEMLMDTWTEENKLEYPESCDQLKKYYKIRETKEIKDYNEDLNLEFYNNR